MPSMSEVQTDRPESRQRPSIDGAGTAADRAFRGIVSTVDHGVTLLSPQGGKASRRVLYVNSYGGAAVLEQIRTGALAPHHLWGCFELVRMGYEVAVAEPLPDFYLHRNPLPHDLRLVSRVREWLGDDGIVYCGHNVLYWLPFLKALRAVRSRIVSLLFAREPLHFARRHDGIIALNPAAADHARRLAPRAKVAHLGWGVDLDGYTPVPYEPGSFLSCGVTLRDHATLRDAADRCGHAIRVITPGAPPALEWPRNVTLLSGTGSGPAVPYRTLLDDHYGRCIASLIILKHDAAQYTGIGMTNLLEAMAMARPVILTRTGALPTELDVQAEGCGLWVPPNDADALAAAMTRLASDPTAAEAMGQQGRRLCEQHYNIVRYARDLHDFFESL